MLNTAIIAVEAVVAVPAPDEPIERMRLVPQGRMRARRSKRFDHILRWITTLRGRVRQQKRQRTCRCDDTENYASPPSN